MKINNSLLYEVLGINTHEEIACERLGLIDTKDHSNILTFFDSEKFIPQFCNNPNISAVFITEELNLKLETPKVKRIICEDPRYYYYTLYNYIGKKNYKKKNIKIHSSAKIHHKAFVADYNIEIAGNVIIEPNVTILPDVIIGKNCIVRAGAVLGSEGFEHKRTKYGILPVFHNGKVIIGENVEIGANTCIDKGFFFRHTIIGDFTKIDNLVHIAHGVQTGKGCFIIACSMVAGSVTLKDNVWIGPNANIAPYVIVENCGFVTLGSVVTKNVEKDEWVTGNFAIPHKLFLKNLKKSIQD